MTGRAERGEILNSDGVAAQQSSAESVSLLLGFARASAVRRALLWHLADRFLSFLCKPPPEADRLAVNGRLRGPPSSDGRDQLIHMR